MLLLVVVLAFTRCESGAPLVSPEEILPIGIVSLELSPEAHEFTTAGDEIRLSITAHDADGAPITSPVVTWSTSDSAVASVDPDGTVTARGAGTATIRASTGETTASSDIEVFDSPPPPTASASNEPAGYASITDRAFDARNDAGWGYNESSRFAIVTDKSAPRSCCTVAQARYNAGFKGGSGPVTTWKSFTGSGHTEIYVSFWLKLSDNWQGHSSGVNKIAFVWIHGDAAVYFSAQGSGSGTLRPQIRLQDVPGTARNLRSNVEDVSIERGKWHHWEVQLTSNSGGKPNGIARLWLDGTLVSDYRDVAYSSASQGRTWQHLYWNPIWGGMGDAVKNDMYMNIDHIYASGR